VAVALSVDAAPLSISWMETQLSVVRANPRSKQDPKPATTYAPLAICTNDFIDLLEPNIRVEGELLLQSPLCDIGILSADVLFALTRQAKVDAADVVVCAGQCIGVTGVWTAVAWYHLYFTVVVPFVTRAQKVKELLSDHAGITMHSREQFTVASVECTIVISDDGQPLPPLTVPLQPLHLFRPLVHHLVLAAGLVALVYTLVGVWRSRITDAACPLTNALTALLPLGGQPGNLSRSLCDPEDALYRFHFDLWARSIVTDTDSFALLLSSLPVALIASGTLAAAVGPVVALLYVAGMATAHGLEHCVPHTPAALWLERWCLQLDRWASLPEEALVRTGTAAGRCLAPLFTVLLLATTPPPLIAPRAVGFKELLGRCGGWYTWSQACFLQGALGAVVWTFLFRYLCIWTGLGQALKWLLATCLRVLGLGSWLVAEEGWLRSYGSPKAGPAQGPWLAVMWHSLCAVGFALIVGTLLYYVTRASKSSHWGPGTPRTLDRSDDRPPFLYGTFGHVS